MRFKLDFSCDNADFDGDLTTPAADILRSVSNRVRAGHTSGHIKDDNGNTIGEFTFDPDNEG